MQRNANFKDLTGKRFGYLTPLYIDENKTTNKHLYWMCQCVCGKTRTLQTSQLTMGKVTSCGCKNKRKKHDPERKRMYSIYSSMLSRCYNPKSISYCYYGKKGITVCDEWKVSFESFANWADQNNYNDSLSIERIDNSKGYSPENCCWIPLSEQANNKTTTVLYTHDGETHNLKEWCRILDFPYALAKSRRKEAKRLCIEPTFEYVFAPNKKPHKRLKNC